MIVPILMFFIIWEVIAIFYYKSKGEEEQAERSINLTVWFVVALIAVLIISAMLTPLTVMEQGYDY